MLYLVNRNIDRDRAYYLAKKQDIVRIYKGIYVDADIASRSNGNRASVRCEDRPLHIPFSGTFS